MLHSHPRPCLPPSPIMALQLRLGVFIIGFKSSLVVEIESSELVDDLKKSIWKECPNALKGVDANRLTLYQVELPDGEMLGQLAAQAVKEKEPLSIFTPLSEILTTDLPEETISILIEVP